MGPTPAATPPSLPHPNPPHPGPLPPHASMPTLKHLLSPRIVGFETVIHSEIASHTRFSRAQHQATCDSPSNSFADKALPCDESSAWSRTDGALAHQARGPAHPLGPVMASLSPHEATLSWTHRVPHTTPHHCHHHHFTGEAAAAPELEGPA